jgi:hypothetical protein
MTIRTPAIVAVLTLLVHAADNRVSAQPIAPNRPPSNAFGSLFYPGSTVVPNAGTSLYGINRAGANGGFGPNNVLAPGFGSQGYYGPWAPYILSMQPVVFNNRGHWYSNYSGHWYPNGLTNGTGVLSNGGTGGVPRFVGGAGSIGGPASGVGGFGPATGMVMPGGIGAPGGFGMPGGTGLPGGGAIPVVR